MKENSSERSELINGNYGLVHSCANRFRGRGVEYDDLFQAGCIGLIKAADNFDKERGFAFSTYAVPVILGEIKRIFRDGGLIKVGRSLKEKSRNALKVSEELTKQLGREPTVSEIAEKMGVSISKPHNSSPFPCLPYLLPRKTKRVKVSLIFRFRVTKKK